MKLTIYVPMTHQVTKQINLRPVERVTLWMTHMFGGCTRIDATGTYQMATGEIVTEPIAVISATFDEIDVPATFFIICNDIKVELAQESVAYEIESSTKIYFT